MVWFLSVTGKDDKSKSSHKSWPNFIKVFSVCFQYYLRSVTDDSQRLGMCENVYVWRWGGAPSEP